MQKANRILLTLDWLIPNRFAASVQTYTQFMNCPTTQQIPGFYLNLPPIF